MLPCVARRDIWNEKKTRQKAEAILKLICCLWCLTLLIYFVKKIAKNSEILAWIVNCISYKFFPIIIL